MSLNGNQIENRPRKNVIRSMIVAVLAAAAMLLGLFTMHSGCSSHEMSATLPTAAAHANHSTASHAMATIGATAVSATAHVSDGLASCGENCMLDCALGAMTCGLLLALASMVLLARSPSVYHRLLDAGGTIVRSFGTAPLAVHRPNLIFLSISRT